MPLISTGDSNLHQKLRVWVAKRKKDRPGITIGRTVDDFIKFCLEAGIGDLSEQEKEEVKKIILNELS